MAFTHDYSYINTQLPAEADMRYFFGVTPLAVHQMVLALEPADSILRASSAACNIRVLVLPEGLPVLHTPEANSS